MKSSMVIILVIISFLLNSFEPGLDLKVGMLLGFPLCSLLLNFGAKFQR